MADLSNNSTVILCPGQGAQHVGMGKAWADKYPVAARSFDEANDVLGFDLCAVCFDGPADELNRTDVAQAAIYVTSVVCHRALVAEGKVGDATATAGLSLGEFTALHLAGAFDFASGLKLVRLRGQAMQSAAEAVEGGSGMVALMGADEAKADELCQRARDGQVLVPANFNCPGQVVVSGSAGACQRAVTVAQEMGLRAMPLVVAGAFHSPLMAPAAQRLATALDQVQWQPPGPTVVSNVTALPHVGDIEAIKRRLVEQLTSPVRWAGSMQWLIQHAPGRFIELAPGKVLSGLMRKIDRGTKVENFAEPD